MKEIVRQMTVGGYPEPLTDLLDPNGLPYLVLEVMTNKFYILYWKAWFIGNKPRLGSWSGSDWYDTPPIEPTDRHRSRNLENLPKTDPIRIWELPTVEYDPPTPYTNHDGKVKKRTRKAKE